MSKLEDIINEYKEVREKYDKILTYYAKLSEIEFPPSSKWEYPPELEAINFNKEYYFFIYQDPYDDSDYVTRTIPKDLIDKDDMESITNYIKEREKKKIEEMLKAKEQREFELREKVREKEKKLYLELKAKYETK